MKKFPGYLIQKEIYHGPTTIVYRAQREVDKVYVIIKTVQAEYPSVSEISQLRYEYQVSQSIDNPGIVKTYALEINKNNIGIVKEDFHAITIKEYFKRETISISGFLEIAIQLAETLGYLHEFNIIHKDINPSNILINVETKQVKITDFSIASCLSSESYQRGSYSLLEGTPAYISPEQTGRMNRLLDYRTDLYSLGITFYELLAGHLPFQASDLLDLIHCHISQYPTSLDTINIDIGPVISKIVMKLMAKNAEDRYQNAFGLKVDLEYCLKQLTSRDHIPHFSLGKLDHNSQFLIPQKLYGRSIEVSKLLSSFERVSSGTTELILVSGYSGIGKTSIVNEIDKPILNKRGYFARGKFEELQRDIPYFAFLQGFRELIKHLLTESSERIYYWRDRFISHLGNNGQIIIDIIPELELIIGPQPKLLEISTTDSQNRFNQVFQAFVRVFTRQEHPLVIFVDDLQWADVASLKLIQRLVSNSDNQYLLLVGAYRDNEVDDFHPLTQMLNELKDKAIFPVSIVLNPLGFNAVQQLVSDTLRTSASTVEPLVELIFSKSAGNPFFLNQLLQTLFQENYIEFNFLNGAWEWNIEEIYKIKITDYSIIDLIIRSIKKLPKDTQEILKYAACIGNKFSLRNLATLLFKSEHIVANGMWLALQKGLIIPLDESYKIPIALDEKYQEDSFFKGIKYQFLHDQVQQASYSLIQPEEREKLHLRIGKLLLAQTSQNQMHENLFDIVNQMNLGFNLILDHEKRKELALLNKMAGEKAKESTAYEISKKYFELCIELLHEKSWLNDYKITIDIYLSALEIAYINVDFNKAKFLLKTIFDNVQSQEDLIPVYEFQIPHYFTQNQPLKAIDTAIEILKILGINIPKKPTKIDIIISILRVKLAHKNKEIPDLVDLPLLISQKYIAAMKILMAVIPSTFVASPELFPVAISRMVEISLKYGNSSYSIFAYNSFGTLQCGALGNFNAGYQYSLLAIDLLKKLNASEFKSKVYMVFNAFNRPWTDHLNQSVLMLPEGVVSGLETGDIEYVGHCASFFCIYLFLIGENIEILISRQRKYLNIIFECKQQFQYFHASIWHQVALNLFENTNDPVFISGKYFDEDQFYGEIVGYKNDLVNMAFYVAKSFLYLVFNEYEEAIYFSNLFDSISDGVPGIIYLALNNFYKSLSILKIAPKLSSYKKNKYLKKVKNQQKQLQKWVRNCPDNFLNKYQLIEAELAKVLNNSLKAMEMYDLSIASSSKSGYIQEEAIANECAAEFYYSIGKEKVAQVYLIDAYYGYVKWGAIRKISQLEVRYPEVFSRLQNSSQVASSIQTTTSSLTTTSLIDLDLASVLKVSQAISEEIILDQLLEKLMQVLLQTAGAQSVFLILKRNNVFVIEASDIENKITLRQTIPVASSNQVPCSVINYVARTLDPVIFGKAALESSFSTDKYIQLHQVKSLLCLPMINQGHLMGMVYLENNLAFDAFRVDHLEILRLLCAQAAISLENAYLYEDLHKSQEREQAEKDINELKSRFISMTSHEFRTPLTAILGTTELIKHYGQGWDTKKQHSYLDRIQKNVKHMTGLLDDVLVLSKADVGKVDFNPQKINLDEFCGNLVEELQLNTKKEQEIEYVIEGETLDAYADEKILRQILSNLLTNAIKYSSKNTTVRFDVTVAGEEATFYIQDQGIGIPEVDQQHLFESFHRATNVGQIQGTGLGLAIVKKSVELHKGTITFESVADQGTTFIVTLPIAAEAIGGEVN